MVKINHDEYGNKIINEKGSVTFKCPACGETEVSRSKKARELSKEYTCTKCGFIGP
ncbi:MAG: zinc finger domain-containing protein [Nanoarchaeota archaeon]